MKNLNAAKFHPEIAEAITLSQDIARKLTALHTSFADGQINQVTFAKELENVERRQTTELRAIVSNLQYKVSRQEVLS